MNKLFKSTLISGFVALGCASAGPAAAVVDTFNGTTWTLSHGVDLNPSASIDEFLFTLTVDTSTPDAAVLGSYLDSVSIKVASSVTGNSVTGPAATGPWILHTGGINDGGCSGSGGGFLCADVTTFTNGALVNGSTYKWVFDVSMAHGALFTGVDAASVKGRFTNGHDHHVGAITSMPITITSVPEPETYAMFLAGLGLMGFMARRRSKNS